MPTIECGRFKCPRSGEVYMAKTTIMHCTCCCTVHTLAMPGLDKLITIIVVVVVAVVVVVYTCQALRESRQVVLLLLLLLLYYVVVVALL